MVPALPWRQAAASLSWAAAAIVLLVAACASPEPRAQLSQQGIASWYGPGFHGKKTTSGAVYDQHAMTAAHQTLPLGSRVVVTSLTNGKTVTVLINDRGPFVKNRIIDLSYAAAQALDMIGPGTAPVRVDVLDTAGHPLTAIPDRLDYSLQIGAFMDLDKARELKARLESRHDRPVVIEPHEGYYRVRLGTFAGEAEAREYGARLTAEGLPAVLVEKWPPVTAERAATKEPAVTAEPPASAESAAATEPAATAEPAATEEAAATTERASTREPEAATPRSEDTPPPPGGPAPRP